MRVEIPIIECKSCGHVFNPRKEYVRCRCGAHEDHRLKMLKGKEIGPLQLSTSLQPTET